MDVDYGQTATLRMYVSKMSYSEATVSLYQMDSSGWREDMSYDEVLEHVTLIPVASAALTNPALKDINRSDDTPNLGDYNSYVDFEIDSVILGQWLSGSTAYPPSVCMKVLSVGDPVIEFNATESGEQVPYFIVTGGEEALLGQEPFDITVVDPATEPGKLHSALIMALPPDRTDAGMLALAGDRTLSLETTRGTSCFVADSVSGEILYASDASMLGKTVSDAFEERLLPFGVVFLRAAARGVGDLLFPVHAFRRQGIALVEAVDRVVLPDDVGHAQVAVEPRILLIEELRVVALVSLDIVGVDELLELVEAHFAVFIEERPAAQIFGVFFEVLAGTLCPPEERFAHGDIGTAVVDRLVVDDGAVIPVFLQKLLEHIGMERRCRVQHFGMTVDGYDPKFHGPSPFLFV